MPFPVMFAHIRIGLACLVAGAGIMMSTAGFARPPGLPPGSEEMARKVEEQGSHALPIGPWSDGSMLTRRTEGRVETSAWRVPHYQGSTLALLAGVRDALQAQGWRILYQCDADECGGFDFRYSTQVLPEPDMHVDLGDFRYLSAERDGPQGESQLGVLVSRSTGAQTGHVQLIEVGPPGRVASAPAASRPPLGGGQVRPQPGQPPMPPVDGTDLGAQLASDGRAVLEEIHFTSGSAVLDPASDPALRDLADWMKAHPEARVLLVGHSDASGSMDANVTISRRRAEAVRSRLIQTFGVQGSRLVATGLGYGAPRRSHLAEGAADLNRRIEAVLLPPT